VSDVNTQAAQALAARHGAGVVTVDAALADPAIGAVLIASSTARAPMPDQHQPSRRLRPRDRSFLRCAGQWCRAAFDIDDGVKALELAEAATSSWRENRTIDLPQ
jgi:predicted dehydrogenase